MNLFSFSKATPQPTKDNKNQLKSRTPYPSPSKKDKDLSTIGFYPDLSQPPIAGRPVYADYNNYVYPAARVNLQGRKLDCKQPVWGENCY